MIRVKCVGHIGTSVGASELELPYEAIEAGELLDVLRARCNGDPGFTKYNTLVMVDDGDAFVPASQGRTVVAGQKVVLIPFSHGG